MASTMSSDIQLLFSVAGGGDLSGASGSRIQAELTQLMSNLNSTNDFSVLISHIQLSDSATSEFKTQLTSVLSSLNLGAGINVPVTTNTSSGVGAAADDIERTGAAAENAASKVKKYSKEVQSAGNNEQQNKATTKELTEGTKEYASTLDKVEKLLKRVQKARKDWTAAQNGSTSTEYSNLSKYEKDLTSILTKATSTGKIDEKGLEKLAEMQKGFQGASTAITSADKATKALSDRMGGLASKFTAWLTVSQVVMQLYRAMRQMVSAVKEIDSAMTQLQIVTGATDTQMTAFLTNATSLAKELGQSISDVLGSIETFSRLGYNLEDASTLAEYATILANVAAVDTEEATTGLTSIIKGYNMDVQNAEHVADVLVEVGQKYAVSASEMMEAYEKSGAALSATNTSFEKSAGLIAAANAAVNFCRAA